MDINCGFLLQVPSISLSCSLSVSLSLSLSLSISLSPSLSLAFSLSLSIYLSLLFSLLHTRTHMKHAQALHVGSACHRTGYEPVARWANQGSEKGDLSSFRSRRRRSVRRSWSMCSKWAFSVVLMCTTSRRIPGGGSANPGS